MMLVFALLAIVSAAFSQYKEVAFGGMSERYEGLWVWLCYTVFFVVATGFAANKERSSLLIGALCLSALFVGLIGLTQFFGFDIFATSFGSMLVYGDAEKQLAIKFDSVYATLYNPNCAGMFFGMMFTFTALPALLIPIKNKLKYIFAVLAVITLLCLIGSDSVGGFLGAVCGIVVSGVAATGMMIKKYGKKGVAVAVAALVVFVAAVTVLLCTDNMIAGKVDIITSTLKSGASMESASYYKDFYVENNKGYVETSDGKVCIDISGDEPVLLFNDEEVKPTSEGDGYSVYELASDVVWTLYPYDNAIDLEAEDKLGNNLSFIFALTDGNLSLASKFGEAVTQEPAESIGFEGIERLGSNRGYIWSRSIPLLKKNIIIGQGSDCFAFDFPQDDVRAKLKFLNNPYVIVDKPHNMYLQTGINTGVISLVLMIALFVLFIWQSIVGIIKSEDKVLSAVRLGILGGCVAYMVAGVTTDSVVSVAPVFWVMLGTGFGLNMIRKTGAEE
jgi:O-antigen ligase